MKHRLHIVLVFLLALCQSVLVWGQSAASRTLPDVTSTEGREFFVAWLPNGDRTPQSPDLKLQLIASSRKSNTIVVEMPNGSTKNYPVSANGSIEIEIDAQTVYWDASAAEEETPIAKGIRVYSAVDERFTLYSTSQYGAQDVFSLDGAHILPVEALGTEYMVLNADGDNTATEFVLMSTKPGVTNVTMNLKVNSRKGNTQQLSVALNGPKQIYIVRSMPHAPNDLTTNIDLSGSTICADQPIAVWSGNQDGLVPYRGGLSTNHAYDQLLPVTKWGKSFIIPMTAQNMQMNVMRCVALEDNTVVTVKRNNIDMPNTPATLNSGDVFSQVMTQPTNNQNPQESSLYVTSDKPIQVYLFSSSAGMNTWYDAYGVDHLPGNPSMTLIPPLEFLTDTTIVQTFDGGLGTFVHELNLWALSSATGSIKIDNQPITTGWKTVPGNPAYSQNTYTIPSGQHVITAPSKCFSGYMYGIDEALAYLYPVGYDFTPKQDSLFLLDDGPQYNVHHNSNRSNWNAKGVSPTEGGWYLDKVLKDNDRYELDSVFVCDSTILTFPIKTYNTWYKVKWEIEGSIQGRGYFDPLEQLSADVPRPELNHQFHLLPIKQNNAPYEDFEVRGILLRKPIFCDIPEEKWERDTFNTIVRVLRQYNDTTWRAICIGDTLQFFYDSLYSQSDLSQYDPTKKDHTSFIATTSGMVNPDKWKYNIGLGTHTFQRHYISSNGCDSLSTIKIYVCPRYYTEEDTVVCEERTKYLNFGRFFERYSRNNSWPKADTVLYDTLRAVECMNAPDFDEFRPYCPDYNGCDSVMRLHLKVMRLYTNTKRQNQCMSMGSTYEWREPGSGRLIAVFDANTMTKDSLYIFRDTVRYNPCERCPGGQCDSVRNILHLQFVSDAGQEHTIHVCQGKTYTYTNENYTQFFDSNGKRCNTPYVYTGTVDIYGYNDYGQYVKMCSFEDEVTFYIDTVYHDQMTYDTICWDPANTAQTYAWEGHPKFNAIPVTRDGIFHYYDTMRTSCRCDSICVLHLTVGKPYEIPTVREICDDDSVSWQDTLYYGYKWQGDIPAGKTGKLINTPTYTTRRELKSRYDCDSILTFALAVHPTYIAERKDTFVCANEIYHFYGTDYNTPDNRWTPGQAYELTIHDQTKIYGCDSMVLHRVEVYPIYLDEREANDTVCQVLGSVAYYDWSTPGHEEWNTRHLQPVNTPGTYELEDPLTTIHGCDSIIHRTLVVLPTYDQTFPRQMSSEDTIHWEVGHEMRIYAGEKAEFDNPDHLPVVVCPSGPTIVVDSLTTTLVGTHGCDSVRTLRLLVGQTFRDTTYDVSCANCGTYSWTITSPITGQDTLITIADLPAPYQEKTYYDSLKTELGYDSIYVLRLTSYPSYTFSEADEICQGAPYSWSGHMPNNNAVEHRLFIDGEAVSTIPTDKHGEVIVVDSMRTDTIYTNPKTGIAKQVRCDSVWTLTLTIHPTYNNRYVHLEDYVSLASNDTVSHFTAPRTLFVGYDFDYKAAGITPAELEVLYPRVVYINRSEGTHHYDSVVNTSANGCDSTHYVHVTICEVQYTYLTDSIGDNDTTWHFGGDTYARQHTLEPVSGEKFHYYDDGTPVDYSQAEGRIMREYLFIDTLRTASGCDSIVHDTVRVFPTYEFRFDTAVCSNTAYNWRGRMNINREHTGFYYDSVNYTVGRQMFDSVYVLYLEILPAGYWSYDTVLCMNDTLQWHYQTIYYRGGGLKYVEAIYKDDLSACGDVYHLDLTFAPFYGESLVEYDTICQMDDIYRWISPGETEEHTLALRDADGKPISFIPGDTPGDFLYYDSLKTKGCGCDSTYTLYLHIAPSYHFYTDTAICTGDEFEWDLNGNTYSSLVTTHLHDTIYGTTVDGCDSIYYLHVFVDQPYEIPVEERKCLGDEFEWNGKSYNAEIADSRHWSQPREFFDTLRTHTTIGHCDSVMYLHLVIGPSADSVWTDTICIGEQYRFFDRILTEPDAYLERRENAWGCMVNYRLTLVTIPHTEVTLVPEPVCVNDAGADYTYTLRYRYQGEFQPILYNVIYDSVAQEAGFVNQEQIPMAAGLIAGEEYELDIPTPRIDIREEYPRPDKYYAVVTFENGVCLSDSLMHFPIEVTMSYPRWITEQRYGDVIALLDSAYNGGYQWAEYQWFEGDSLLVGQTKPYLYLPMGLNVGAEYHVELTRPNEKEAFPTCPVVAVANPIVDDFAPRKGYLAVTPTCLVVGNPTAHILSRKDGTYRVTTSEGAFVTEGVFRAPVTPVAIPAVEGLYIVQLWSNDTPEEPYRAIKVLVSQKCPNCDISSF